MTRLDARIKTEISAFVSPYKAEIETVVNVVELSLSGLLIEGWVTKTPETLRFRLPLEKNDDICLYGDIVRINDSKSAIQSYIPERITKAKLWEFIRDRITYQDTCPYCNNSIKSTSYYCSRCGWYLNFKDENYLDKHLDETFLNRIMSRTDNLNAEQRQRVLNFIDRDLLAIKNRSVDEQFVGVSEKMLEVFSMVRKVAPTEYTVLILGESGSGKWLTAKTIHERSQRKNKPFIVINCAGIPETLLETALFGYEKGSFRGALASEKGKLEMANGGTVFLYEIGETPLSLQAKLLRVLKEGAMERLGSKRGIKVDVRVMASSDRSLEQEVKGGRFLLDLYHSISTFTITLPSLNERGVDKIILAKYYLKKFCMAEGISKRFSKKAIDAINSYPWPGNVRELINKIQMAIAVSRGDEITPADLSLEVQVIENIASLRETKASSEKQKLMEVLEMTSYNISKASVLLGVSRPTIYSLIKKYHIGSNNI